MGSRGSRRRRPAPKSAGAGRSPGRPVETAAPGPPSARAKARRVEAARRAKQRRRWIWAGVVVAVIAGVGVAVSAGGGDGQDKAELEALLTAGDCRVDERTDPGRDHVARPTFKVDPPAGGDHQPRAAGAGVYDPDDVPSDGELVHALEHGFVILWYRPGIDEDELTALEDVADQDPEATLVVPRESLDVPVAATAWHRRLLCPNGFEKTPLVEFVKAYRDKGPEKGFVPKRESSD